MKRRNGFVSNSSSSSFIISLPKTISEVTQDDVKDWFGLDDKDSKIMLTHIEHSTVLPNIQTIDDLRAELLNTLDKYKDQTLIDCRFEISDDLNDILDRVKNLPHPQSFKYDKQTIEFELENGLEHGNHWNIFRSKFPGQFNYSRP